MLLHPPYSSSSKWNAGQQKTLKAFVSLPVQAGGQWCHSWLLWQYRCCHQYQTVPKRDWPEQQHAGGCGCEKAIWSSEKPQLQTEASSVSNVSGFHPAGPAWLYEPCLTGGRVKSCKGRWDSDNEQSCLWGSHWQKRIGDFLSEANFSDVPWAVWLCGYTHDTVA